MLRQTAFFGILISTIFLFIIGIADCKENPQIRCSKQCVAENCNSIGIKYGKYCGVGWSGCHGEKPCNDLDACCQIHDDCVGKKGMTNVKCLGKPAFRENAPMTLLYLQWNRVWTWPFYLASLVTLS